MKILVTGDLHWNEEMYSMEQYLAHKLSQAIEYENPDAVVIAGDIFEHFSIKSPYKLLEYYLPDLPIICVLGNHEFMHFNVEDVYKKYEEMYRPDKRNIHYLDICGYFRIGCLKFIGNALWYDGSLQTQSNQDMWNWADGMWSDKYIKNFDPVSLNNKCIKHIRENSVSGSAVAGDEVRILVTHHIPHKDLNGYLYQNSIGSKFDVYSGMNNLFQHLYYQPTYAFCGHTHSRVLRTIQGINCVNIGNDYFEINYEIVEI